MRLFRSAIAKVGWPSARLLPMRGRPGISTTGPGPEGGGRKITPAACQPPLAKAKAGVAPASAANAEAGTANVAKMQADLMQFATDMECSFRNPVCPPPALQP